MNVDRQKHILELILKHQSISVKALSEMVFASESSVRRDLIYLEEKKLIKRTHGGVELVRGNTEEMIPFVLREFERAEAKQIIAKKASQLVCDNDVIFMDGSSTAYNMIPLLSAKNNITVITNGVKTALKLCEYKIKTISTGGDIIPECLVMVGQRAVDTVMSINADAAFFSCRGVSEDGFATDISFAENAVRQKMILQSKRSYLLCTSDRFCNKYSYNLAHTAEFTGVITELYENDLERKNCNEV